METDDNFGCYYIELKMFRMIIFAEPQIFVAFLSYPRKVKGTFAINLFQSKCKFKTFKFA